MSHKRRKQQVKRKTPYETEIRGNIYQNETLKKIIKFE